jgi:hypothetical protein
MSTDTTRTSNKVLAKGHPFPIRQTRLVEGTRSPTPYAAYIDVHKFRTGVITHPATMQGQGRVPQF